MTDEIEDLADSWRVSLEAKNRAPNTIDSYLLSLRRLSEYLISEDLPTEADRIDRRHVEGFIAHELVHWKPNTAGIRYRSLQQFFRWLVAEDEIQVSPMGNMTPPTVPEQPVPVVSDDGLRALLATCEGKTFEDRRDMAIFHLFISTPCRLSEIALLDLAGVDLRDRRLQIVRKGRRPGAVPFGPSAAMALDRYIRVRKRHPRAENPRLWLGPRGGMTPSGLAQMLERRCIQAGLPKLHWHQFRHTFSHEWLRGGGSEGDLMALAGWRSRAMLKRYGSSLADERARESYAQRLPGERLG